MRGAASEFFSYLPLHVRSSFDAVKTKFESNFDKTSAPSASRWELFQIEQREDESLQAFLTRMQKMMILGFPETAQHEGCSVMFVEAFLRGCRDKKAAMEAGIKLPANIEEAFQ